MKNHKWPREDFIVITGGPGAGKTTPLNELRRRGYPYVSEVAREVIQTEMSSDGDALPWKNAIKYRDLMLDRSIEGYHTALSNRSGQMMFFDRGIPDTLAYSYLIQASISESLGSAVQKYRYNKQVFILPPWKDIYQTDSERVQDFEEALATYHILFETYKQLEHELIVVPTLPVDQRAAFVLRWWGKLQQTESFLRNFDSGSSRMNPERSNTLLNLLTHSPNIFANIKSGTKLQT